MSGTTNAVGLDAGMWNDFLIAVARINNVVVAYRI
jgi:hypothetical protein